MRIVGLTGGIACGKSLVTGELQELGIPVLDCDKIARIVVEPGTACREKIVALFKEDLREMGEEIEFADGTLNRKGLGRVVFANAEKRALLTKITGNAIFRYLMERFAWHFAIGTPMVVVDAPTLYESKFLLRFCSEIIVIAISSELQLERLLLRDPDLSREDAMNRIKSQIPIEEKINMANEVIYNEGTREETKIRVAEVFARQQEKANSLRWRLVSAPGMAVLLLGSVLGWYATRNDSKL